MIKLMKDVTVVHVLAPFFFNKWIGAILKKIFLVACNACIDIWICYLRKFSGIAKCSK